MNLREEAENPPGLSLISFGFRESNGFQEFIMARALFFLAILSYCSGVSPQPTLTQPASQSVSPRETIKITCTISSNPSYVGWYQQKPGQGPRYVHVDGGYNRGEGIPDRFTASRSGNMGYLTIADIQPEDEAIYFCGMGYSNTWVFGTGTHLAVTGLPTVPPSVTLFPPSQEEIRTKKQATIPCLADGFYPGNVQVSWLADGNPISSGVETTKPTKQGDKYVASSYLTMSEADWQRHDNYACKVTHEGQSFEKSVNRVECSS